MLELHVPSRAELVVRQRWLADPEMMAFNAHWDLTHPGYDAATGCIDWPEREWPAFEARLRLPVERQGYFYVRDTSTGAFVGHAHYEVDPTQVASVGLNVVPAMRGQGLGVRVLELIVARIWHDSNAQEITNDFEDERIPAARTHRRCGFAPDATTRPGAGRSTRTWRLARPAGA